MIDTLPPNATPLERRIAAANAAILELPVEIGTLMDPDRIPLKFLPWLAWHFSVDTWRDDWPEQVKRARVKSAIRIARTKGTAAAVRRVCASFGANVVMREWFEMKPRGKPGTFEIVMTVGTCNGAPATAAFLNDIVAEVDNAKRGTAHYTLTAGFSAIAGIGIGGGVRAAVYRRLHIREQQ